jgi:hypothetical protein
MAGRRAMIANCVLHIVGDFVEEIAGSNIDTSMDCMTYDGVVSFPYSRSGRRRCLLGWGREGRGTRQTGETLTDPQIAQMLREVENNPYPLRDPVAERFHCISNCGAPWCSSDGAFKQRSCAPSDRRTGDRQDADLPL